MRIKNKAKQKIGSAFLLSPPGMTQTAEHPFLVKPIYIVQHEKGATEETKALVPDEKTKPDTEEIGELNATTKGKGKGKGKGYGARWHCGEWGASATRMPSTKRTDWHSECIKRQRKMTKGSKGKGYKGGKNNNWNYKGKGLHRWLQIIWKSYRKRFEILFTRRLQ